MKNYPVGRDLKSKPLNNCVPDDKNHSFTSTEDPLSIYSLILKVPMKFRGNPIRSC